MSAHLSAHLHTTKGDEKKFIITFSVINTFFCVNKVNFIKKFIANGSSYQIILAKEKFDRDTYHLLSGPPLKKKLADTNYSILVREYHPLSLAS
jgi:hypothetical protein